MHIELEQFDGPLDLLLSLIEEEKIEISTISLARVADQYLIYISQNPETPLETMLHFLEIGSRLVVLKTRLLLPHLENEDENADDLVAHLKQYREYRAIAIKLNSIWTKRKNTLYTARIGANFRATLTNKNEINISKKIIHSAFARIVSKIAKINFPPRIIARRIFNLHERIATIQKYLKSAKRALFSELVENGYKHEIIINFLALLELAKSRAIFIRQQSAWGEITIEKFYASSEEQN
ncbi:MAG: hypothetical protein A3H07_05020 [Candidatus Jacksonbacteria bacterium RIFCSPLOWO2_12_FULL_44_15b]|nr:MAG: hypothetical protein A3H07_05020 [Candidatus Jacksonbacteria bacterium RIFCSPLOWO2_12_FULL_44_15b]